MFIELTKDKSLKNILLKADIDEHTLSLVKSNASITEIKNSLVDNINAHNIVQYRKFILKAEEEFASEQEVSEARARELSEQEQSAQSPDTAQRDDSELETTGDLTAELEGKKKKTGKTEMEKQYDRYLREVKMIMEYLEATKDLVQNLEITRDESEPSNFSFRGQTAYANKFNTQQKSNSYLNLMKILDERDKEFLVKKYRRHFNAQGDFPLKGKNDVNISTLTDNLLSVFNSNVGNRDMSLGEAFSRLHINTYKRQPTAYRNIGRYKKDISRAISRVKGMPVKDEDYEKAVKIVNNMRKNLEKLNTSQEYIESVIAELEFIENDGAEKIIARKIKSMTDGVKILLEQGMLDETGKRKKPSTVEEDITLGTQVRGLENTIRDIQENSEEYIEEATEELRRDIEIERTKLTKVNREIERINQYLPEVQEISRILVQMNRPSPRPEGRSLSERQQIRELVERRDSESQSSFRRIVNAIQSIDKKLKEMSRIIDTLDEMEAEEFMGWITGEAGQRPQRRAQLEIEGLDLVEGFDTINNRDINRLDRLGAEVENLFERVERFTNSLVRNMAREITYDDTQEAYRLMERRT